MRSFTSPRHRDRAGPRSCCRRSRCSRHSAVKVRYSARMISMLPLLCWRQARASVQPWRSLVASTACRLRRVRSSSPITTFAAASHSGGICACAGPAASSTIASASSSGASIRCRAPLAVAALVLHEIVGAQLGGVARRQRARLRRREEPEVPHVAERGTDVPAILLRW